MENTRAEEEPSAVDDDGGGAVMGEERNYMPFALNESRVKFTPVKHLLK